MLNPFNQLNQCTSAYSLGFVNGPDARGKPVALGRLIMKDEIFRVTNGGKSSIALCGCWTRDYAHGRRGGEMVSIPDRGNLLHSAVGQRAALKIDCQFKGQYETQGRLTLPVKPVDADSPARRKNIGTFSLSHGRRNGAVTRSAVNLMAMNVDAVVEITEDGGSIPPASNQTSGVQRFKSLSV